MFSIFKNIIQQRHVLDKWVLSGKGEAVPHVILPISFINKDFSKKKNLMSACVEQN